MEMAVWAFLHLRRRRKIALWIDVRIGLRAEGVPRADGAQENSKSDFGVRRR